MVASDQLIVSMQISLGPSKKDSLVRRRELLGSGKGSLAARLLAAVTDAAAALLHGKNSGDLISEAVRGGSDGAPAASLSTQWCCVLRIVQAPGSRVACVSLCCNCKAERVDAFVIVLSRHFAAGRPRCAVVAA